MAEGYRAGQKTQTSTHPRLHVTTAQPDFIREKDREKANK